MNSIPEKVKSIQRVPGYALLRQQKRQRAALALASRVIHPVQDTASPTQDKRSFSWLRGPAFGLVALLFHGGLAGTLMALADNRQMPQRQEKVIFQVVEPAVKPEPEVLAEEPIALEEASPTIAPSVEKTKPQPAKRIRAAKADPVDIAAPDPAPEPRKRAVVGITMSSTVTAGSGPVYAVGNTRMGETQRTQSSEKVQPLSKGRVSGAGGDSGTSAVNKQATFIPTVSSNFTRPVRISSADLPYPTELKSKGVEGNVVVLIVINEQGVVQKVRILKSSGYREFDEAALRAAEKELYTPALRDGEAVEYNLKYTYRFRIKGA